MDEHSHLNNVMDFFLNERNRREMEEINRLIDNFYFSELPHDFWEPVKVTIDDSKNFNFKNETWECVICRQERNKKTELECCKQPLCDYCVKNWFNKESVKCPFCKKDIREIY